MVGGHKSEVRLVAKGIPRICLPDGSAGNLPHWHKVSIALMALPDPMAHLHCHSLVQVPLPRFLGFGSRDMLLQCESELRCCWRRGSHCHN